MAAKATLTIYTTLINMLSKGPNTANEACHHSVKIQMLDYDHALGQMRMLAEQYQKDGYNVTINSGTPQAPKEFFCWIGQDGIYKDHIYCVTED